MSLQTTANLRLWQVLGTQVGPKRFNFYRIIGRQVGASGELEAIALFSLAPGKDRIPEIKSTREIVNLLSSSKWHISNYDPFIPKIRSSEQIKPAKRSEYVAVMHRRHAIVKSILASGWSVFDPSEREQLIQKAREPQNRDGSAGNAIHRHSGAWVRKMLYRYWRYGGSAYGLLPGQINNGAIKRKDIIRLAALENKEPVFPNRKTGPNANQLAERPDLGPIIDPALYMATVKAIKEVLNNDDLKYGLAYSYDQRRAIPWEKIREEVNALLAPTEIQPSPNGPILVTKNDWRLLTRRQVRSIGEDEIHLGNFVMKVKSAKALALDHRPRKGSRRDAASYSGQRVAVDVLSGDVFVVNDKTRLPTGRLHLVFVVDVYSGAILAAYVWAGDPDFRMITYALAAAAMPKSEWGNLIGLPLSDIDHPYQGLPEAISCDNGEAARHTGEQLPDLVCDVIPNPPHAAYLNHAVETTFNVFEAGCVKWYPGSSKGPRARHSEDRMKKATGSLADLMRQANRWAMTVYNYGEVSKESDSPELVAAGVKLTRRDLWIHGLRAGGGDLVPFVKERHIPALLESKELRITESGIDFDGVYYDFPAPVPDWFHALKVAETAGKAHVVRAHFDRATLNRIYLVPKDPKLPVTEVPLSRLSAKWRDFSRKEYQAVQDQRQLEGYGNKHEHDVRKVKYNRSQKTDVQNSKEEIDKIYGSIEERNKVATAIGTDAPKASQMQSDAERDQKMHANGNDPSNHPSPPNPSNSCSAYDELLGLT